MTNNNIDNNNYNNDNNEYNIDNSNNNNNCNSTFDETITNYDWLEEILTSQ